MRWFTVFAEAFINLRSSKLRALLALLGILVGTASVVAMVSGGELATNEAMKQFKTLGTDLLSIAVNDEMHESKLNIQPANLTVKDVLKMHSLSKQIIDVAPYTQVYTPVQYEGHEVNTTILGVTDQFASAIHLNVAHGRFISAFDHFSPFCVIGQKLYQTLKGMKFKDPLGQQLQVGSRYVTIVGIADDWPENNFVYASINNALMMPIESSIGLSQYATINNIIIRLKNDSQIDALTDVIKNYLKQVVPSKKLYLRSAKELIQSMTKQSHILTLFLSLIGSISLLVGGIGVMNIMLVSVVERKREIGIRLSVGARARDIQMLFLAEAILLALIGGGLGVVTGLTIAFVLSWLWHWTFILFLLPPIIGFSVSVCVGVFFGFYPAWVASKLDPIVALKTE